MKQSAWVNDLCFFGNIIICLSNYYYTFVLVFGLLVSRKPVLVPGFALLIVVWSGMGTVYDYKTHDMFMWSSLAILTFYVGVMLLFAMPTSQAEPMRIDHT